MNAYAGGEAAKGLERAAKRGIRTYGYEVGENILQELGRRNPTVTIKCLGLCRVQFGECLVERDEVLRIFASLGFILICTLSALEPRY
jgi:hypothetical protein